jgi:hypothetical protein
VTDYNQVPLGSNHFTAKHRLQVEDSTTSPKHTKSVPDVPAVPAAPANLALPPCYPQGYPLIPPQQQHHYGYPYQPLVPYGNQYASGFAFPPIPPIPGSSLHSNQVQLGERNQAATALVPKQPSPSLTVPQAAVKAFCDKYDLGDEEREGLQKLGFRVGDALDTVTESEWLVSGLAPLHRRRVLLAWNTENSPNGGPC